MLPDWLEPFFTYWPIYMLFFLGVGIPWALVLLPRDEWRNRPTVFALALALGPLLSTTWLFLLGTWGRFVAERAVTGVILLAIVGFTGAWLRRHTGYRPQHSRPEPWLLVEKTLVAMMVLAFGVHIWITMFWPFVQYDTLWTFGYNARVFLTFGNIPDWIDYYPQLVPLTYTFGQLIEGDMNDHVAKAAVPWFMLSSVVMAYILGARVWGKRSIGILTAALWMLIPSALFWSGSGDLEHPVTIYFTGAVVFFILAWRSHHWRYALISGLMFGGALWTKPTAGSFAFGVMLVIALMGLRLILPRPLLQQFGIPVPASEARLIFRQKFTMAAITGLASIPIGAMWYIRNVALGHAAIIFPDGYWNDFAQRSGQEFGWLILIALLATAMVAHRLWPQVQDGSAAARRRFGLLLLGLGLFLLGTLPSALVLDKPWESDSLWNWAFWARPQDNRLSLAAVLLIIVGLGLMAVQLWPAWQKTTDRARSSVLLSGLLALPFAVGWFYGYSYHYRLMLTITPVLAAMVAALIDAWLIPFMSHNKLRQRVLVFLSVWLSIPALVMGGWLTYTAAAVDKLQSDAEKYAAANPALMEIVEALRVEDAQRPGRDYLNVYTLGEKRLNFFFPHMTTIWNRDLPTDLDQLHHITDVIVGGTHADFLWDYAGTYPNQIAAYMDVGTAYTRPFVEYRGGNIMGTPLTPIEEADDGTNRLVAYEVYTPYRRYSLEEIAPPVTFEGEQWDFLALRGMDLRRVVPGDSQAISPDESGVFTLRPGEDIFLQLYWQRTAETPIPQDYYVFVHLLDAETGDILAQRDGPMIDGTLPMTLMPYPDLVPDRRLWSLPDDLPPGPVDLYIGLYDPVQAGAPRLPLTDGAFAGEDGILLRGRLVIAEN